MPIPLSREISSLIEGALVDGHRVTNPDLLRTGFGPLAGDDEDFAGHVVAVSVAC